MLRLLRFAAAARQRRCGNHRSREERRRHQGAADLLHDDTGLDTAESAAAEGFRHQEAGEAHLGKALPELGREAGGILGIAQAAQMRDRRLVADETARTVAQHGLFFGEDEGHGESVLKFKASILGFVIPGRCVSIEPGISRFRVRC
jgi:hypothetical protein